MTHRERKYWLFKSEPSNFSFDNLKNSPSGTAHWDGVRNYQARNYLRDAIMLGDGVLFYHSSIARPHIAGIAMVVRGGYPDWTAMDPESEYFDPASSVQNPIWYMVDVRYVVHFVREVFLDELKEKSSLVEVRLLRRSRLSIQPVTRSEWCIILEMGGISADDPESLLGPCEEGT
jgi:predicted RNA-binding protein with PUA-like domain